MKRITNYALNCLIEQGISKEHIKSLIKAIENQTRDNILTPEQAIEILLDGVIYEEELHQQTVLDSNACNSGSTRVEKALYSKKEADLKNYITDTAFAKIISKVPSKFWNDCMIIYTLGKYYSIDHAAKEWFEE